jgi:hypothetical protein
MTWPTASLARLAQQGLINSTLKSHSNLLI